MGILRSVCVSAGATLLGTDGNAPLIKKCIAYLCFTMGIKEAGCDMAAVTCGAKHTRVCPASASLRCSMAMTVCGLARVRSPV